MQVGRAEPSVIWAEDIFARVCMLIWPGHCEDVVTLKFEHVQQFARSFDTNTSQANKETVLTRVGLESFGF